MLLSTRSSAKVVLVTGASPGGIGFSICREWSKRGHQVYGAVRRPEVANQINEGQHGFEAVVLDVTDETSVWSGVAKIIADNGRIDVLVNNAGISYPNPIAESKMEGIKSLFETNVFGLIAVTQAVFPHMAAAGSGLIVNIGSITSFVPTPWGGPYAASKACVKSLSSVMRMEMKPFGIRVLHVALGGVTTNLPQNSASQTDANPPNLHYYLPFLQIALAARNKTNAAGGMHPDEFARRLVSKCLDSWFLPTTWWTGAKNTLAWVLSSLPESIMEHLVGLFYGFGAAIPRGAVDAGKND